jgi:hypothetical protein
LVLIPYPIGYPYRIGDKDQWLYRIGHKDLRYLYRIDLENLWVPYSIEHRDLWVPL